MNQKRLPNRLTIQTISWQDTDWNNSGFIDYRQTHCLGVTDLKPQPA
jgi:hypothetical protein